MQDVWQRSTSYEMQMLKNGMTLFNSLFLYNAMDKNWS